MALIRAMFWRKPYKMAPQVKYPDMLARHIVMATDKAKGGVLFWSAS